MDSSPPIPTIPEDAAEDARPRVLLIRSRGQEFAFPIESVVEVIRPQLLTPIPGASAVALGLVNVRGMVRTVLDLAILLFGSSARERAPRDGPGATRDDSPPPPRAAATGSVVLLEHRGRAVGVAVDAVLGVQPLDAAEDTSAVDAAGAGNRLAHIGERRVTLLDPTALLAHVMLSSEDGR